MNYIPLEFNIMRTTAAASTAEDGSMIPEGKSKMRLVFGDDPRFHILAKTIKPAEAHNYRPGDYVEKGFLSKKKYVVMALEGKVKQNVLVSVVSLAQRLHLSEDEVIKSAHNNRLARLIRDQLPKVKQKFYTADLPYFKADLVQKIVAKLLKGEAVGFEEEGQNWVARVVKGEVKVNSFNSELSYDYFGKTFPLGYSGEAVKIPKYEKRKEMQNALKNEHEILTAILPKDKSVLGLQSPIQRVTVINGEGKPIESWNLTKLYYGDYLEQLTARSRNFETTMSEIHQLLFALQFLFEKKVFHGDLQPGNIKGGEKTGDLHITNFSGSRLLGSDSLDLLSATFTPQYTPIFDRGTLETIQKEISDAAELRQWDKVKTLKKEFMDIAFKMEVFAMGTVLFQALTNNTYPYSFVVYPLVMPGAKFPKLTEPMKSLENPHFLIPEKLTNLVKRMLDPDYRLRPTPKEAFDEFKLILNDYPDLKTKFTAKEG